MAQLDTSGFIQQYVSELRDLTFNSKAIINTLTMLASENKNSAQGIADAVIKHVTNCPPASKLPALYLLDSITKNVGLPYTALFAQDIPNIFKNVWSSCPNSRSSLQKLCNTWQSFFPSDVLNLVTLVMTESQELAAPNQFHVEQLNTPPTVYYNLDTSNTLPAPQSTITNPNEHYNGSISLQHLMPDSVFNQFNLNNIQTVPNQPYSVPPVSQPQSSLTYTTLPQTHSNSTAPNLSYPSGFNQTNLPAFLNDLVSAGLLSSTKSTITDSCSQQPIIKTDSLTFKAVFAQEYTSVALATLRKGSEETKAKFLDQKLSISRKQQSTNCSRRWYVIQEDWLAGTTADEHAAPTFFEEVDEVSEGPSLLGYTVPADSTQTACAISGEEFETVWNDDTNSWHYTDACCLNFETASSLYYRYGLKEGQLVKASCILGDANATAEKLANAASSTDNSTQSVDAIGEKRPPPSCDAVPDYKEISLVKKNTKFYLCDEILFPEVAYYSLRNQSCLNSCDADTYVDLRLSSYHWLISDWNACSVECDGGTQSRLVSCIDLATNSQVGNSLCDKLLKPQSTRPCNPTPCMIAHNALSLKYTAWSNCAESCDLGFVTRQAYCVDVNGNLADALACANYTSLALFQKCTKNICDDYHWLPGKWSNCSESCNGGYQNRTIACADSDNKIVGDSLCSSMEKPVSGKRCKTKFCIGYTWMVGDWGNCSASCGGGIRTRTVECVNQQNKVVSSILCNSKAPADQLQCNVMPCDFCSHTNCAGQGVCKDGVCVCNPGFRGSYCEISSQCSGILDQSGNCCANGIVDFNGTCCSEGSTLDASAKCCVSGLVDACGKCDGDAKLVDVSGFCCNSGILDAAGFCCTSGFIDECGVCDGNSQSCLLRAIIIIQVALDRVPSATLNRLSSMITEFAASLLDTSSLYVLVDEYAPISHSSQKVNDPLQISVTFSLRGLGQFENLLDLRASVATQKLVEASGKASSNDLIVLKEVTSVARQPLCGNQICESGERGTDETEATGCQSDCIFPLKACPSSNNQSCSGHGICYSASGKCVCFNAYAGAACNKCAEGYLRGNSGLCTRYVRANLPLLDKTSSAGVLALMAVAISLIVVSVLALVISALIIVRHRRQIKAYNKLRPNNIKNGTRYAPLTATSTGSGKLRSTIVKRDDTCDTLLEPSGDSEKNLMSESNQSAAATKNSLPRKSVLNIARIQKGSSKPEKNTLKEENGCSTSPYNTNIQSSTSNFIKLGTKDTTQSVSKDLAAGNNTIDRKPGQRSGLIKEKIALQRRLSLLEKSNIHNCNIKLIKLGSSRFKKFKEDDPQSPLEGNRLFDVQDKDHQSPKLAYFDSCPSHRASDGDNIRRRCTNDIK